MSLELRGGRVLFQYDLGTGPAQLWSKEAYNDGQWHSIFGKRLAKNGLLKVDDVTCRFYMLIPIIAISKPNHVFIIKKKNNCKHCYIFL